MPSNCLAIYKCHNVVVRVHKNVQLFPLNSKSGAFLSTL